MYINVQLRSGVRNSTFLKVQGDGEVSILENNIKPSVVVHAYNHSTWEVEAKGLLHLRPTWAT